jgi:hypothetical protein
MLYSATTSSMSKPSSKRCLPWASGTAGVLAVVVGFQRKRAQRARHFREPHRDVIVERRQVEVPGRLEAAAPAHATGP